jgi:hypothetical protein
MARRSRLGARNRFDPKLAWRALSKIQKATLREQRLSGRVDFGATPGKPAYWVQQDVGMGMVGIPGSNYIEHSIDLVTEKYLSLVKTFRKHA